MTFVLYQPNFQEGYKIEVSIYTMVGTDPKASWGKTFDLTQDQKSIKIFFQIRPQTPEKRGFRCNFCRQNPPTKITRTDSGDRMTINVSFHFRAAAVEDTRGGGCRSRAEKVDRGGHNAGVDSQPAEDEEDEQLQEVGGGGHS